MELPDLSGYRLHKVVDDVDLDGVVVRGLRGSFHRSGTRTVGVYSYAGAELFMAWGYVGEPHCRYTALRRPDGSWEPPRPGCPPVSRICDGGRVTALTLGGYVLPASPVTGPPSGGVGAAARDPMAALSAVGVPSGPPPAACATGSGSLGPGARPGLG
jgi:hypothetical protein